LIDKERNVHILRGERYRTPENAELADFIEKDLHFLDYEAACRFYAAVLPELTDTDYALLGCNDRFFLFTVLLGRKDGIHPWLYDRCREVESDPDGFLDLWSREHYKSSLITFAGIIQEVLVDPEVTIGIFSFKKSIACDFVAQIKREFEANDDLKRIYADVLWQAPAVQAPKWSQEKGIIVRRTSNPKEATLEGSGLIDGMPTGRHYHMMVYDDLITERYAKSPEQVRKATEQWEMSDNLGAGEVRKWHIGTRYSFGDSYGIILERGILKPRIFPATDDGTIKGKPVFMSEKRLAEKIKAQRTTFAAQMLQNPLAGNENTFRAEWFNPYFVRPRALTVYIMGDPSKGRSKTSDRTAISVVGIDGGGNKYLLDGVRHRMSPSERWTALRDLWKKWSNAPGIQLVRVGWEHYGQVTDGDYFRERMMQEGISFGIDELNWVREGGQSKKDRVERLEPDFRLGRFYVPGLIHEPVVGSCLWKLDKAKGTFIKEPMRGPNKIMQEATAANEPHLIIKPIRRLDEDRNQYDVTNALMEEMLFFPFAPKDDFVDATSRIYDMQPIGPSLYDDALADRLNTQSHPDD
jgi:hypothetical protein